MAKTVTRLAGMGVLDSRTPGQKAADTKREQKGLSGSVRQTRAVPAVSDEPELHLTVTESLGGILTLRLGSDDSDLPASLGGWQITANLTQGRVTGHDTVRASLLDADSDTLAECSAELSALQAGMTADRETSDDRSLARLVMFLGNHYQVKATHMVTADGTSSEIRRSESFLKAHQFVEAFIVRNTAKPSEAA